MSYKGPKGMILLAQGNRILEETVRDQILFDPNEKRVSMLDVKLCDFDEVGYNVLMQGTKETVAPMHVMISCSAYNEIKEFSDVTLKNTFGDLVMAADDFPADDSGKAKYPADAGIRIDLENLPADKNDKEKLIKNISLLKYHTLSGPYKKFFDDLNNGKNSNKSFKFDLRCDTTVFFFPRDDRVIIVYAIDFKEEVDKCLARVFMQELCDARKRVRTAPPFSWAANPPSELSEMGIRENPGILGYASIAVLGTHCKGKKIDEITGALINFRTFLQYHIKCAKSFFHSRMRKRCSDLLKILNRSKVKFGVKEKKNAAGKTFKRN